MPLPSKPTLRVDEVARYFTVSPRTIRAWVQQGLLARAEGVKPLRVSRDSVAQFVTGTSRTRANDPPARTIPPDDTSQG